MPAVQRDEISAATRPSRAVIEALNKDYEHHLIEDIDAMALHRRAATSGFTLRELSMIQPTYARKPKKAPPTARQLTERDLARFMGPVNRCVHATLTAWDEHPRQVSIHANARAGFLHDLVIVVFG